MTALPLLDTDTITLYQHGHAPLVARVAAAVSQLPGIGVTIITIKEQMTGRQAFLRRAKTDAQLAYAYQVFTENVRTLSGLHVVTFTEPAIRRFRALLALKLGVGGRDLRIAAIALEEGATVITRSLRDFQRVPGLACENWAD